ncbi:dephospho-CoA kinase [Stenotrophomonas pictorum JCM 9942]|uniref:Dephospho-CoA kinase n=1 Tax=Stenotrophomonas pictorum JCM 9942 TaxID=1236960 RepID=A0A0Q9ZX30_9GAMM|nr:dephospho-CoA kinase [Stenotrophomonas pictorum]KRG37424.1 dephospho-CoA kinase [Stenotrophomonas pictorum JCM 9942]
MSTFIVGLTGGIASGKSEVSRRFEALGITVADADIAARDVVAVGTPALEGIVERFGPKALQSEGSLDRAWLRRRVFADPVERRALEAITHPAIRARLKALCEAAQSPYAIAAIPLLTEAGGRSGYPWLDRVLVIDTPEACQLSRLRRRDSIDEALAQRMIQAQATRAQRLALADDIIVNEGTPEHLQPQVEQLDRLYRQLAQR